jgi:hypothetical protein
MSHELPKHGGTSFATWPYLGRWLRPTTPRPVGEPALAAIKKG